MEQIRDWLEKLGLSEYAKNFAENDIDLTLLPELTDQDLEKNGIASLGHRRKILKAIASLDSTPVAAICRPHSCRKLSPQRQRLLRRRRSPRLKQPGSAAISL
jgi:hypothetical protein